jgi:biotin carboxyl carrier protein
MKYIVSLNGKNYEVDVEKTQAVITGITEQQATPASAAASAATPAAPHAPAAPDPHAPAAVSAGAQVTAPMPGTIISIEVATGQTVKAGEIIMTLEAMKMENDIVAPVDGVIKQILVKKGSSVNTDEILAIL